MARSKTTNHIKSSRPKKSQPTAVAPASTATTSRTIEGKPAAIPVVISRPAVAEAAYFLWLQRGGSDTVNWLEAEAQLRSQAARA